MSWLEELYRTYENNLVQVGVTGEDVSVPLWPEGHVTQNAHVEVALDGKAGFQAADVVPKEHAMTIVPVTEDSAGRTSSPVPHPLHDKLQYTAGDYVEYGGQEKRYRHGELLKRLDAWCRSPHAHPKVEIVLKYLRRGTLIQDLVKAEVLFLDGDGRLMEKWTGQAGDKPEIFTVLPPSADQSDAFIRFEVRIEGDPAPRLWEDPTVWQSWRDFQRDAGGPSTGLCYVSGQRTALTVNPPKKIRNSGDSAKLISSNDTSGYTFRGRFSDASQACGLGREVSQKAHSALRWLIGRQGYREDTLAVVAWAVSGAPVPSPLDDSMTLFGAQETEPAAIGYTAQDFGNRLAKKIAGYRAELGQGNEIIVLALDSPSFEGRMGVKYHRELEGSEFLERIEDWHRRCAWPLALSKERRFVGAPAPRDIALAAYGSPAQHDSKLRKSCIERLLPCIVDGVPIPRDIVDSCVRRACNRAGQEYWRWEACLGIACALFNGMTRRYDMALERDRKSRDYLYGRLLALADNLEAGALRSANEKRETTAGRLMQRFSDRPFTTWKVIETALGPYKARLRANRPGILFRIESELDEVMSLFNSEEFCSDAKLTGEFLLGFHCQRADLYKGKEETGTSDDTDGDAE